MKATEITMQIVKNLWKLRNVPTGDWTILKQARKKVI